MSISREVREVTAFWQQLRGGKYGRMRASSRTTRKPYRCDFGHTPTQREAHRAMMWNDRLMPSQSPKYRKVIELCCKAFDAAMLEVKKKGRPSKSGKLTRGRGISVEGSEFNL